MKTIKRLLLLLCLLLLVGCGEQTTTSNQATTTSEAPLVNLVLNLNEDEVFFTGTVEKNMIYELPMTTTDDEHIYVGWSDGENVLSGSITIQNDMDLLLVEEKISDVFTFDEDHPDRQAYVIYGYTGQAKYLKIPILYNGLPIYGIGRNAFVGNDILEIYIPNNITSVSTNAFNNLEHLKKVVFYGDLEGEGDELVSGETLNQLLAENTDACTIVSEADDGTITYADTCPIITSKSLQSTVIGENTYTTYIITYLNNDFPDKHYQKIYEEAFYDCPELETVTMSNTDVTFIKAFFLTPNLKHVDFPESKKYAVIDDVVYYKEEACLIYYPSGLSQEHFDVPEDIKTISQYAFNGNQQLKTIHLPKSIESVSGISFYNLKALNSITVDSENTDYYAENGILFYNNYTFKSIVKYPEGLNESSYIIPIDIKIIDSGCFAYNEYLQEVIIPLSVLYIGDEVFANTTELSVLDIPENVVRIGYSLIEGSNIETLIIRRSLEVNDDITSIYYFSPGDNKDMQITIYVPDDSYQIYAEDFVWSYYIEYLDVLSNYTSINDFTYVLKDDDTYEITSYTGNESELIVPSKYMGLPITSIGDSTFVASETLMSITIPNTITKIGWRAFFNCTNLININLSEGLNHVGSYAFYHCTSLESVIIPDGVTIIDMGAFKDCSSLTSISISNSVLEFGLFAFIGCQSLTSITIPESVETIGEHAFENCTSLTDITVNSENENFASEAGVLFNQDMTCLITYPEGKTDTSYQIPEGVITVGNNSFENIVSLVEIVIPDSVESIIAGAFRNCTSLISINIPGSIQEIGYFAFNNCTSLQTVTLNSGLLRIEDFAFQGCTSLTSVILPDSVLLIGNSVFRNCISLTKVTLEEALTSIGKNAFKDCDVLTDIVIPDSVLVVNEYAFENCDALTIYCEATTLPLTWDLNWNPSDRPVIWGYDAQG